MRNLLLIALMLSGFITGAQTSITNGNCRAAFKYAVNDKVMSLVPATAIDFYDRSEGKVTFWFWDFGDGNTSTEQNPMFVFNHPLGGPTVKLSPYRTVSLTVLTADSCKSFYSEIINIMDGTTYSQPPCKARFKYYQTAWDSIAKTASFQLTNLSDGDSLKYLWQFDDGKTSTEKEPIVTFDLSRPDRKVCLTISGINNCTDQFCDAVYAIDPNIPVIDPVDPKPVECETVFGYSINYDIKTFAPALVLDFYSKAWPEPVEWSWDFGDGYTSNEANPMHIFSFPIVIDSILGDPNPFRKVCLTVKTVTGCVATWCETIDIYVTGIKPDTTYVIKPVNTYTMRYESSFPIQMSSCAGWAKAQVYLNNSLVKADKYVWSNGTEGQDVKGLCPTQMYTVKAVTPDGTYVTGTFVFNSNGTVTEAPFNWWVSGYRDNPYIQYDLTSKDMTVEWRLCDGTIVKSDSIPLNSINCENNQSNLILKDASGNVVYSEIISLKTLVTGINPDRTIPSVKFFPNPVKDVLNIQYSGNPLKEMQLEICDIAGRTISLQKFFNIESGQTISLNVNSLRQGIYFCKMLSGKQIIRIEKFSK